jgi:hypothetical protein
MNQIIGIYIRMPHPEILRLRDHPDILPKYDPRVALADGRGLDLGRGWEELGVFIDGGVKLPDAGPTVGEEPLPNTDTRATWSYIAPERVVVYAEELTRLERTEFTTRYHQGDPEDTADSLPGSRTDGWGDRAHYLRKKLRALSAHFARAAGHGEAMLVRIGARI